jgi:hypothetical protein
MDIERERRDAGEVICTSSRIGVIKVITAMSQTGRRQSDRNEAIPASESFGFSPSLGVPLPEPLFQASLQETETERERGGEGE